MAHDADPPSFYDQVNANIYGALSKKVQSLPDDELMKNLERAAGIAGRAPNPFSRNDAEHVARLFALEAERRGLRRPSPPAAE